MNFNTFKPMPAITASVMRTAEQHPDAIFGRFLSGGTAHQITFDALDADSCAYAQAYMRRGFRPHDSVLIEY